MRTYQSKLRYRERPRLRKTILGYLKEYPESRLEDIAQGFFVCQGHKVLMLGDIKIQARKMLEEKKGF